MKFLIRRNMVQFLYFGKYFIGRKLGLIILTALILNSLSIATTFGDSVLNKNANPKDTAKRYFDSKNYTNSITWYKKASINNPNDMGIYEQIGRAYWELGNYEIALNWYKVCNKAEEKINEAEKSFRRNMRLNPKDAYNYSGLGWVYSKRRKPLEAIKWLKKAIRLAPNDSNIYASIGWIYAKENKYKEAIDWFKNAIQINPKNIGAYEGIAWAYIDSADYKNAFIWLNSAKKV